MIAASATVLPTGGEWSYEVKWDGYRSLALKDGADVRLVSRNSKNLTTQYPAIAAAVGKLNLKTAIFDGEVVALDRDGRPSFQALQHRTASHLQLAFYVFDLLHLNGRNLMKRRLDERRADLASIDLTAPLLLSDPLPGSVSDIEAAVRRLHLESRRCRREAT
jgi:bifunctional non-homologous end joining protein LigD